MIYHAVIVICTYIELSIIKYHSTLVVVTIASGRAISRQMSMIWLLSSRSSAQQGRGNTTGQSSIKE